MCRALLLLSGMEHQVKQEIGEKCSFSDFGIMLDLSRNAVLKTDTIRQMICYAACLGYKFVGLKIPFLWKRNHISDICVQNDS